MSSSAADWYTPPRAIERERIEKEKLQNQNLLKIEGTFSKRNKDLSEFINQIDNEMMMSPLDHANNLEVRRAAQLIVDIVNGKSKQGITRVDHIRVSLQDAAKINLTEEQTDYIKEQFSSVLQLNFVYEQGRFSDNGGYTVYIRKID
jgi:uncharacterized protein YpuA (DUF1002 family)